MDGLNELKDKNWRSVNFQFFPLNRSLFYFRTVIFRRPSALSLLNCPVWYMTVQFQSSEPSTLDLNPKWCWNVNFTKLTLTWVPINHKLNQLLLPISLQVFQQIESKSSSLSSQWLLMKPVVLKDSLIIVSVKYKNLPLSNQKTDLILVTVSHNQWRIYYVCIPYIMSNHWSSR